LAEANRHQPLRDIERKSKIAVSRALAGSSLAKCDLTTILDSVDGRLTLQVTMELGGLLNSGEATEAESLSKSILADTLTPEAYPVDIEIYCGKAGSYKLTTERRCS